MLALGKILIPTATFFSNGNFKEIFLSYNSRRIIRVILFFNLNFLHIYHKSSIQNLDMKGYVSALIPTATIEEFLEIFLAW